MKSEKELITREVFTSEMKKIVATFRVELDERQIVMILFDLRSKNVSNSELVFASHIVRTEREKIYRGDNLTSMLLQGVNRHREDSLHKPDQNLLKEPKATALEATNFLVQVNEKIGNTEEVSRLKMKALKLKKEQTNE